MSYSTLIFTIVCALACWGAVSWLLWRKCEQSSSDIYILFFASHTVAGLVPWAALIVALPLALAGVDPDYGSGEVDGYLFEVSHEGVVWKTWEATILVGKTEADSVRWNGSTGDKARGEELMRLRGKKVRIKYRRWFSAPCRVGSTRDEIVEVEAEKAEAGEGK